MATARKKDFARSVTFRVRSTNFALVSLDRDFFTGGFSIMDRRLFAGSVLSTAVGLAFGMQGLAAQAQGMDMSKAPQVVKDNMMKMQANKLEKCYGINVAGKNDCAEGAHSCAGQATQARDPKSFVLLPAGDCSKIQGGKTSA
jgi:uncharacterized membrane protein